MSENLRKIYRYLREHKSIGEEQLKELESMGMIPKDKLKDRTYYRGICRNTRVAMWVESPGWPSKDELPSPNLNRGPCFYHMREKANVIFIETINHPADDDGFDLFTPVEELLPSEE